MREDAIEEWLFMYMGGEIEKDRLEWEVEEARQKQVAASVDRAAIKRKLSHLKELYVNEIIDLADYRRDYELYTAQLAEAMPPVTRLRPNFEAAEAVVANGFRDVYSGFDREAKRALWHSIIKEIHIDKDGRITGVAFL